MTHTEDSASSTSKSTTHPKRHANWHEAASCTVQIELRDYIDMLDFQSEFILGKNNYRIDQVNDTIQYTVLNISITFLAFRYPRKLIKHLMDERNLEVEKFSPGIYHINKKYLKHRLSLSLNFHWKSISTNDV